MVKLTVLGSYNQDITMITPKIPRPKETITGATLFFNPGGKGNNQANGVGPPSLSAAVRQAPIE